MFTGLVEEIGKIIGTGISRGAKKLMVQADVCLEDLKIDDSIAINGVCLTVVKREQNYFTVEAVDETLKKSTLGQLRTGDVVNLERALIANGRLGGHFVQGHVDGVAKVKGWQQQAGGQLLTLDMQAHLQKYMIPKGSITIDGVSLTIANLTRQNVQIALIPHTLAVTTLGKLKTGDDVNIEVDMLGKYVYRFLTPDNEKKKSYIANFDVKVED
ncbi:MAG: riboflavin synthase [bacterium]